MNTTAAPAETTSPTVELKPFSMGKIGIYGMATPFGVRLCTDYVSAGLNGLQMMATGGLIAIVASLFVDKLPHLLLDGVHVPLGIISIVGLFLYMCIFRLTPLAGIHASEHMVVHALEQDVPLTLEGVRQMPREHPRCGTNIMGIALLVMAILTCFEFLKWEHWIFTCVAVFIGFRYGKKLGTLCQRHFTTKDPTDEQLQKTIRVGGLLVMNQFSYDLYRGWRNSDRVPYVITYLFNMGMVEFVAGNLLVKLVFPWFK